MGNRVLIIGGGLAGFTAHATLVHGGLEPGDVAVFLGLATASTDNGGLGFVMLDDPSQSLGSQHKKQLVQVLQDVAGRKQVLLATMDGELRTLLAEHLGKAKTEYAFGPWAPETGSSVMPGRST